MFLEPRDPGIQKHGKLAESQVHCSWIPKIQKSQNRRNWLRDRAHVPGVWKSRNPKTKGID